VPDGRLTNGHAVDAAIDCTPMMTGSPLVERSPAWFTRQRTWA
jgi:hypothetical protein